LSHPSNELATSELYQKFYQANRIIKLKNANQMEQKIEGFNRITVGKESYANVLRFQEVIKDKNENVLNTSKNEWLYAEEINT